MHRITRSLSHLVKLLEDFEKRVIDFKSIQENFSDTSSPHGRFLFYLLVSIAQLKLDFTIERTRAGFLSAQLRGVLLSRQPGLSKKTQHKAIFAEKYYRKGKLSIKRIIKLLEISSKRTLCKNVAHQKSRTLKRCGKLFWDTIQSLKEAYYKEHLK